MAEEKKETGKVTFRKLTDEEAIRELGASFIALTPKTTASEKDSKSQKKENSPSSD